MVKQGKLQDKSLPQDKLVQGTMSDELFQLVAMADKIGMSITQFGVGYEIYPTNDSTVLFSIHPEWLKVELYLQDSKESITEKIQAIYKEYRWRTQG